MNKYCKPPVKQHLADPKIVNIERWLDKVNESNVRSIAREGMGGFKA